MSVSDPTGLRNILVKCLVAVNKKTGH
jgi:hypothetical protein